MEYQYSTEKKFDKRMIISFIYKLAKSIVASSLLATIPLLLSFFQEVNPAIYGLVATPILIPLSSLLKDWATDFTEQ